MERAVTTKMTSFVTILLAFSLQGSTHEGKFAPAGVIQIHDVLPVEYSSPIKRPRGGRAALSGNSPW
jgi:hypothetical protein